MAKPWQGRRKAHAKVSRQALFEFYVHYYELHHTVRGANKAAARFFRVTPSTISHHVKRLREFPPLRRLFYATRRIRLQRAKPVRVDRQELIHFVGLYYRQQRTAVGLRAAAARRLGVSKPTIHYHIRRLLGDPQVPAEIRDILQLDVYPKRRRRIWSKFEN